MFSFLQPAPDVIRLYLARQANEPFSYDGIGCTREALPRRWGWNIDHERVLLGAGRETFELARRAIDRWQMFPPEVATLCWPQPPRAGLEVAVLYRASLVRLWMLFPARIVYVVDDGIEHQGHTIERYGFAYGTLPDHPERGEERFLIEWDRGDDCVWYDLFAVSQPAHWLARLGYFYTRMEQARFRRLSCRAMQLAAAEASLCRAGSRKMTAHRTSSGGIVWLLARLTAWLIAWFVLRLALAEAILCFAALVLVPLALRWLRASTGEKRGGFLPLATWMQFPAAAALAISFVWPPGLAAQAFAVPWLLVTLTLAAQGCRRLFCRELYTADEIGVTASLLFIAVGGVWAVISRLGLRPQNFSPTIVLLTAVHFHFAGFVLPLLAGRVAGERARRQKHARALPVDRILVGLIVVGVPAVGLGISLSRPLEVGASLTLAAGCLLLAVRQIQAALEWLPPGRITLAIISSLSLLAAMSLAAAYAITHVTGTSWPDIATMIRTHGVFNAFGFAACGLMAWAPGE
jgi:uncharacterized protein (UPF0548 family)